MDKTYWKNIGEVLKETPEFEEPFASEVQDGMNRREFLRLMGASLALAASAGCVRRPVEKIVPYLNKPEEITPGVANWYATTCMECPAACGVLAKSREGRPIKLEGNPDHPLSQGGLCARGQASILNLYDPDRLQGPIHRSPLNTWDSVTWEEADRALQVALKNIREKRGSIRLLTGAILSPATQHLIQEFLSKFENAKHIIFEPLSLEGLSQAQELCYGEKVIPHYLLDEAKIIVSFGCDFLDTWLSPVEFTRNFAKGRRPANGGMSRFICFESVTTITGANADLHIPVRPGDELKIALGLAHELVVQKGEEVHSVLKPYSLEKVALETGVDSQILRKIAKELMDHRGEGLVLGGRVLSLQIAVNFLNSLLENDGATIDAKNSPSRQEAGSWRDFLSLLQEMREGKVDSLFIYKANPAYTTPRELGFEAAIKNVPVVVNFADRIDETALLSHWVLPDHHYLESWGDAEARVGLFSLQQPLIEPLYNTRAFGDSLLRWTMEQKTTWYDYLKRYWEENIYKKYGIVSSFTTFWETALRDGVFDSRKSNNGHAPRTFNTNALTNIKVPSPWSLVPGPLLILYPTIPHYDGRSGNNAWLMELPDPVTKITWNNYVMLSPSKAKEMGLKEGDVLKVKTKTFEAELILHIQPALHPEVAAIPLGFGRTQAGRVGNLIGVNGFQFLSAQDHSISFVNEVSLEKTGKWERLATTQPHHELYGRPIIQETTLEEYQKDPKAGGEGPIALPTIWSEHKYEGYRWGMAIDLNACTGCSACVIACQAENNIPVVGEERVKKGREMHWLRIDRYYSGDLENPEASHQPMLCQHCENAPCETVCPVLATLHNEEGLNIQVYNRCVGTRYCSNNCPYKVRRFNWFEYLWKTESPLALVLNPDVTVREKGVMEKCTFCIQRIQEGKDKAKDFGRKVKDGEIKTACQQSCPAEAIVFGDLNDPESKVAKLSKDPRGYHVLSDLNTRPSITYLRKVRNT